MMRPFVVALIAALLGLGGGTGIAVFTAKPSAADSTAAPHADADAPSETLIVEPASGLAADTAGAGASHAAPAGDRNASPPSRENAAEPASRTDSARADQRQARAAAPVRAAPTDDGVDTTVARGELRRLGRIFGTMPPRDAARVLLQLEDADILVITRSLQEKQVAAIYANFPPERAAALSRATIRRNSVGRP